MKRGQAMRTILAAGLMFAASAFAAETVVCKGNPDSKVYHKPGCRFYASKGCTKEFKSEAEAAQAGYAPCKMCCGEGSSAKKGKSETKQQPDKK